MEKQPTTWWHHASGRRQAEKFIKESFAKTEKEAICRLCRIDEETSEHVLCIFNGLARTRFQILRLENQQAENYMHEHL